VDVVILNKTKHLITISVRKPGAVIVDARSAHKMSDNVIKVPLVPGRNIVNQEKFELIRVIAYFDHLVADGHIEAMGYETPVSVQRKLEEKIEVEIALREKAEKELKEVEQKLKSKKEKKNKEDDDIQVVE
jgi:MinD-like ATPase involved in chromosome partitioning or flagellar assembly